MSITKSQPPTILLVEPDDETRPFLVQNLRREGYRVIVALDVKDALERLSSSRDIPDIILLDQVGLSVEEYLDQGREIRSQIGSEQIPIVIMPERYGEDLEGKNVKVGTYAYVCYYEDAEQVRRLLFQCLKTR